MRNPAEAGHDGQAHVDPPAPGVVDPDGPGLGARLGREHGRRGALLHGGRHVAGHPAARQRGGDGGDAVDRALEPLADQRDDDRRHRRAEQRPRGPDAGHDEGGHGGRDGGDQQGLEVDLRGPWHGRRRLGAGLGALTGVGAVGHAGREALREATPGAGA